MCWFSFLFIVRTFAYDCKTRQGWLKFGSVPLSFEVQISTLHCFKTAIMLAFSFRKHRDGHKTGSSTLTNILNPATAITEIFSSLYLLDEKPTTSSGLVHSSFATLQYLAEHQIFSVIMPDITKFLCTGFFLRRQLAT